PQPQYSWVPGKLRCARFPGPLPATQMPSGSVKLAGPLASASLSTSAPLWIVLLVLPLRDVHHTPVPSPTANPSLPLKGKQFAPSLPPFARSESMIQDPFGALGPGVLYSNKPIGC